MYLLHGKLTATQGHSEELAAILLDASRLVSNMPGCRLYLIGKNADIPEDVYITEIWDNKEAHDNSLKNEEVRALIMKAMPLLDGQPVKGQQLDILGGFGI
jgi:quinol monooxygenase YgiN